MDINDDTYLGVCNRLHLFIYTHHDYPYSPTFVQLANTTKYLTHCTSSATEIGSQLSLPPLVNVTTLLVANNSQFVVRYTNFFLMFH